MVGILLVPVVLILATAVLTRCSWITKVAIVLGVLFAIGGQPAFLLVDLFAVYLASLLGMRLVRSPRPPRGTAEAKPEPRPRQPVVITQTVEPTPRRGNGRIRLALIVATVVTAWAMLPGSDPRPVGLPPVTRVAPVVSPEAPKPAPASAQRVTAAPKPAPRESGFKRCVRIPEEARMMECLANLPPDAN